MKCSRCKYNECAPGLKRCERCRNAGGNTKKGLSFDIDVVDAPAPTMPKIPAPEIEAEPGGGVHLTEFDLLISAAKKRHATVENVCGELNLSPVELKKLIHRAQGAGFAVDVAGEYVGIRESAPSGVTVDVVPIVGEHQIIGAISDTHFGSKYTMRSQLRAFVEYAYSQGVRDIMHSGDMLDGCYDHGRWELLGHGADEQTDDAIATMPAMPGLSYHCITGNHDHTFCALTGLEIGPYIVNRFVAAGRNDIHFYGNRSAYLRVRGALIQLWHPRGAVPYALSYRLQKQVEAYSPGLKPDILLTGHLHKHAQIVSRGIHAFLVPCFQGGGSEFSNSLVGQPANGGLILRWGMTEHGTLRSVTSELVSYYENERPREITNEGD